MNKYTRGFTIVELLIVIVIIGILAAVVIISYQGIQQRANNTQTISVVNQYAKALGSYAASNSKYPEPSPGGVALACLGDSYPDNLCANTNSGTCGGHGPVAGYSWFNDAIKPFLGNKAPTTSLQIIRCNDATIVGGWFYSNYPIVGGTSALIAYYLNGDVECGSPAGNTATKTLIGPSTTYCYIILQGV